MEDVEDLPIQGLVPVWEEHKERWCGRDVKGKAKRMKK